MISGSEGASVSAMPTIHSAITAHHEAPPPEAPDRPAGPRREHRAGEIDDEDRAEPAGGKIVGRRGEMEADIGEGADEIEQHAEADRVGREQLAVAEMREHLPAGGEQPFRAHEFASRAAAGTPPRSRRQRRSPASAMKPARQPIRSARMPVISRPLKPPRLDARRVDAGGGGRFARRPFVADIGDGDREDRRQHQPLHAAPEDQRRQASAPAPPSRSGSPARTSRRRSRACGRARRRPRR